MSNPRDELAFPTDEYYSRIDQAQRKMREYQLDGLLITGPANFRYFAGFDSQFWESPTRPWFLVVPSSGKCVAVVPEIGAPVLTKPWIEDVRTWPAPRPADDGVSLLAATLLALPRRFSRIGAELGREMSLRMPLLDFIELGNRLSRLSLVDGSACIWDVRRVKSAREVACIRRICSLVSDAFEHLPTTLRSGQSEVEICRSLTLDLLRRGADAVPFLAAASGQGGYSQIIARPASRTLREGDVLIIDVGATCNGYFSDFDRNYGFGRLSDAALRAHEAVWMATEAGIAAALPGATVADLWSTMMRVLEDAGMRRNNVGRLGHGLGLQLTEPPSNMAGDLTKLEAGMVITIEPGMEYAEAKMLVHEEDILVTDSGPELLSRRAPREMPIVR